MKLLIHRGTDEIGATCIDLQGGGSRIIVDAGLPLNDAPAVLPDDASNANAFFLSHAHPDHFGLLPDLSSSVTAYAGELTWRLMQDRSIFLKEEPLSRPFKTLTPDVPIFLDTMQVTPILMDHSAPEAFGFFVEADKTKIFFTGDFRAHGRKAGVFHRLLAHPPMSLDVLLIEGTMLGRPAPPFPDEVSVEDAMFRALERETGMGFVICPGQNVDRLVSAYKAAVRSGRSLVIDIYTAWILERMRLVSQRTPSMDWPRIRVLARGWPAARQYGIVKEHPEHFGEFLRRIYADGTAIEMAELADTPESFLIKANLSPVRRMLNELESETATVFYSMWSGYIDPERSPRDAAIFSEIKGRDGVNVKIVHTGGHAGLPALQALAKALRPKYIIPIHTEHKDEYRQHFDNVLVLEDGEPLEL